MGIYEMNDEKMLHENDNEQQFKVSKQFNRSLAWWMIEKECTWDMQLINSIEKITINR